MAASCGPRRRRPQPLEIVASERAEGRAFAAEDGVGERSLLGL
jgi:hypothetical protein